MGRKQEKMVLGLALSLVLMSIVSYSLASGDDSASNPADSTPPSSSSQTGGILGGFFNQQCKDIVSQYGPNVTDIFMKKGLEESPNNICALIGACKQTQQETGDTSVGTNSGESLFSVSRVVCKGCKVTVGWMQTRWKTSNTMNNQMLDYGKKICDDLTNRSKQPSAATNSLSEMPVAQHAINGKD